MPDRKTYRNRPVALLTKHDKAGMVAPALASGPVNVTGFEIESLPQLEQGLPCGCCGEPSEQPMATIRRCRACGHEMREPVAVEFADPGHCQWCNP
jgi:hypothetical protein